MQGIVRALGSLRAPVDGGMMSCSGTKGAVHVYILPRFPCIVTKEIVILSFMSQGILCWNMLEKWFYDKQQDSFSLPIRHK